MKRLVVITGTAAAVLGSVLVGAPTASAVPVELQYHQYSAIGQSCVPQGQYDNGAPLPLGAPQLSVIRNPVAEPAPDSRTFHGILSLAGADRKLYHYGFDTTGFQDDLRTTIDTGALDCEGGGISDTPYVGQDGNLQQTFALGAGNLVYYKAAASPDLSGWLRVPHSFAGSGPVAIVTAARTDLFYISGNYPYGIYHHVLSNGVWTGPENLGGGGIGRVSAYQLPNGQFRLWLTGTNHSIYYDTGTTGSWTGWRKVSTGGSLRAPAGTIGLSPGREDVFLVGTNGGLYEGAFTDDLATFSGWRLLDGDLAEGRLPKDSDISAAAIRPGNLYVFARFGTGSSQHLPGDVRYKAYDGQWGASWFHAPTLCLYCIPGIDR